MATEFICSIRATGGDYSTLSLWESAIQSDLTSAKTKVYSHSGIVGTVGDGATVTGSTSNATGTVKHATATQILVVIDASSPDFVSGEQMQVDASNYVTLTDAGNSAIAVAEGYADWPTGLNDVTTIDGWTTNSTNYIIIRAAPGQKHNGTPGTGFFLTGGSRYTSTFSYGNPSSPLPYGKLIDFSVENAATIAPAVAFNLFNDFLEIRNCIGYSAGGEALRYNDNDNTFVNCIMIGTLRYNSTYARRPIFKNCTAKSFSVGNNAVEGTAINCVAYGGDFVNLSSGGWTTSTDYNASSNASTTPPPGANSLTTDVTSSDFVNTANNDYHLSPGSILRLAGTNLSSDFTDDIDGEARPSSGAWDIGADRFRIKEFICSIRSTGGDFSTLSSWESAIQADLTAKDSLVYGINNISGSFSNGETVSNGSGVSGTVKHATATQIFITALSGGYFSTNDTITGATSGATATLTDDGYGAVAVAECYNDWPSGLTGNVLVTGWTTSSTNKVVIRAASGAENKGTLGNGFFLVHAGLYNPALLMRAHGDVFDIEARITNSSNVSKVFQFDSGGTVNTISRCIGKSVAGNDVFYSFRGPKFFNCIAIGHSSIRGFVTWNGSTSDTSIAINCTAVNCGTGFDGQNSVAGVKNCVAYNCTTSYANQNTSISTNNAASDAATNTPPGSNPLTTNVQASDFVDAANDDYHLSSGSILRGAGANLSADFTNDIDGDTRPATGAWDIGADHYVSTGGSSLLKINTTTINSQESLLAALVLNRIQTANENYSEVSMASMSLNRPYSSTQNLSESYLNPLSLNRSIQSTEQISYSAIDVLGRLVIHSSSESIAESFSQLLGKLQIITDTLSIQEAFSNPMYLTRLQSSQEQISRSDLSLLSLNRFYASTESVQHNVLSSMSINRISSSIQDIQHNDLRVENIARISSTSQQIGEAFSFVKGIVNLFSESLSISETFAHLRGITAEYTDSQNIQHTSLRVLSIFRHIQGQLSISRVVDRVMSIGRILTESQSIQESAVTASDYIRYVSDTVSIQHILNKILGIIKFVSSTVQAAEAIGKILKSPLTIISKTTLSGVEALGQSLSGMKDSKALTGVSGSGPLTGEV